MYITLYIGSPPRSHTGTALSVNEKQYHLVKVIQKIEVFRRFGPTDVQRLLKVCHFRNIAAGEHIYTIGEKSDEMLIVLRGRLRVIGTSGDELAQILPGMPIGEMGLFTGQPRSADILALDDSTAIVLRADELRTLLSRAPDMHIKVLDNVIGILSQRLGDANRLADAQTAEIRRLETRLREYEPVDGDEEDDEDVDA